MLLEAAEQPPPQRWPGFLRTPPPPVRSGEKRKGWKQEVAQQKATAMVVKEVAVAVGMGRGRAAEGDCPPGLRALALPPLRSPGSGWWETPARSLA